jgi:predicted nuclease of predicted toxin-antitoxin system
MRFLLDNDVDVVVARILRRHGHTCWVAAPAGLADVPDDLIAIYAEKLDAALVSHDRRFAKRRMRNTRGQHVWTACLQVDAIEVLERHLDEAGLAIGAAALRGGDLAELGATVLRITGLGQPAEM